MRVAVFVDAWQQECCGTAFSVRDEVAWQLIVDHGSRRAALAGVATGVAGPDLSLALPVLELLGRPRTDGQGAVLGIGDLRVFLPADAGTPPQPASPDPYPVQLLAEDHHVYLSPRVPPTRGRVTSIRVVPRRRPAEPDRRGGWTLQYTHAVGQGQQVRCGGPVAVGFLVELDVATP